MTQELNEIFTGEKIPEMKPVNFTDPDMNEKLKELLKEEKEILESQKIDWGKIKSFVIKR
jgi:hypothetical protein